MNSKKLFAILSVILQGFSTVVLLPIGLALFYEDYRSILPFVTAGVFGHLFAALLKRLSRRSSVDIDSLLRSEGILVVALTWILTAIIAAIPYLFYGLSPVDAYFEAVSGITTTGATILMDFSQYPESFFFWRSLTQWLGGMGIIVLVVAVLPQLAVAGRQMFFSEAPGPIEEKITPRITNTAKALWLFYLLLTLMEIGSLAAAGMPLFDSVCNSLSTLSAGGFSPHPQSIMGYNNPAFTWIITLFMFLSGSSFTLLYLSAARLSITTLLKNEEFRFYLLFVGLASALLLSILLVENRMSPVAGLRESLFQVVSILTTTGFGSSDFGSWSVQAQTVLIAMMFVGGCAGSAGGGIKVVRVIFTAKYLKNELTKSVHQRAVMNVKLNRAVVAEEVQQQMIGFLLLYALLFFLSGLLVSFVEGNKEVGVIGAAVTLGNIGPGFGQIGPMSSFGGLHLATKLTFIFNMIAGRLELIPVLLLLNRGLTQFRR